MREFNPSSRGDVYSAYGNYGEDEEVADKPSSGDILAEYAPGISSLLFGGDPRQELEKKKATIETYKSLYDAAGNTFLRGVYATKIRSLEAEITALEEIAGEERAAVLLTQGGKIGGTLLFVSGAVAALLLANYLRQKAKTEKLRQQALRQQIG